MQTMSKDHQSEEEEMSRKVHMLDSLPKVPLQDETEKMADGEDLYEKHKEDLDFETNDDSGPPRNEEEYRERLEKNGPGLMEQMADGLSPEKSTEADRRGFAISDKLSRTMREGFDPSVLTDESVQAPVLTPEETAKFSTQDAEIAILVDMYDSLQSLEYRAALRVLDYVRTRIIEEN